MAERLTILEDPPPSEIRRFDLNEQVYEMIKRRLLSREVGGGEKLSLQKLADELKVSRTPVHHALTRLTTESLVVVEPRGYVVRAMTADATDEAHEVRMAIELHAATLTVGRVSDDELSEFAKLADDTVTPVRQQEIVDARRYMLANMRFHEFQVDLAHNATMSLAYRRLAVHPLMERMIVVLGVSAAGNSTSEHQRVVAAYRAGDLHAAHAALRANVETGKRIAREAIEQAGGSI